MCENNRKQKLAADNFLWRLFLHEAKYKPLSTTEISLFTTRGVNKFFTQSHKLKTFEQFNIYSVFTVMFICLIFVWLRYFLDQYECCRWIPFILI